MPSGSDAFAVNYHVRGANRVGNKLRTIASIHPEETDPIIERHVKREAKRLRGKSYPPKLPNQKYVRTMNLGKSFRAQRVKAGEWRIINRASQKGRQYAVWVVKKRSAGLPGQAEIHFGRWWTVDDEAQNNMPELTRNLSAHLEQLVNATRGD